MHLMDGNEGNSQQLKEKAGKVLGAIHTIGAVVAVLVLIGIGIKYLLGSVEEKSEYKQTLIPYIIGAALIFSGTAIPNIIYQIAKNI